MKLTLGLAASSLCLALGLWTDAAHAGLSSCGNIDVDASAECKVEVEGGCTARCEPPQVRLACAGKLEASCSGECTAQAEASCTAECDLDACEAKCTVTPAEFNCSAECQLNADAHCSAECRGEDRPADRPKSTMPRGRSSATIRQIANGRPTVFRRR